MTALTSLAIALVGEERAREVEDLLRAAIDERIDAYDDAQRENPQ